jgi:two-component system OmpR family response regulator
MDQDQARVLVVEDDGKMRALIVRVLRGDGFLASGVRDGREMWPALEGAPTDLILLDIMLPGSNGLDLCRALRRAGEVPIMVVSARGEEMDRVLGLELGADDYLAKPFGHKELLARVRAVLRRARGARQTLDSASGSARSMLRFAGWSLDLRRRELTDPAGAVVDISGAEHDLLQGFLENSQRVLGRDRLLELSRARAGDVSDRSVDVLVSRLRRKIEAGGVETPLIRTVRGVGYMFTAKVEWA